MTDLALHNYFRSSTSVRVRAALNLKGLSYDYIPLSLLKGEQTSAAHLALNPSGLVPTLVTPQGALPQSMAILEWLDEVYPEPPLLPSDPWARARVRSLAQIVALDIHPVNNLRILKHLEAEFGVDAAGKAAWFRTWASAGMEALETRLAAEPETGTFCHGDTVGLADLCLYAQVLNNARFEVDMTPYPTIRRIHEACMAVPALAQAAPANQPDAV
ncbi:maleylacetoacetate isomerase [Sulfitobacter mediterraneus]|uniref:maleylacetoacetate isomerase n=1 Tax=Sulfitobacter mediterraneus TaxID=83219 RepID=UPI00193ACB72|nr:maleylacetoacetate isomerase [Sulfitobacter mediterraneus]MBM1555306.1 maleylacetoacetate isomerase [Sulfitobacter mediterraneus]MBM1567141.1 maleylacetoacetate isomerase [Sulfitobacter mediterraneus]MBM1570943.1 maleylacetoacetate isomerase [Sulfitobacter mediterraneus]MBM1574743.1 maleylacetoacetate isomerase [Sulfitobacter mediterraneus]MBM1578264.1 maleylacetoacetate isomerase [Sulfitobacter mediterraneus]